MTHQRQRADILGGELRHASCLLDDFHNSTLAQLGFEFRPKAAGSPPLNHDLAWRVAPARRRPPRQTRFLWRQRSAKKGGAKTRAAFRHKPSVTRYAGRAAPEDYASALLPGKACRGTHRCRAPW